MRQPTYTEDFRNIEKRFIFQGASPFGNSLADAIEGLQAENAELRRLIKEVAIPSLVRSDELTYSDTFSERLNKDIATLQEAVK